MSRQPTKNFAAELASGTWATFKNPFIWGSTLIAPAVIAGAYVYSGSGEIVDGVKALFTASVTEVVGGTITFISTGFAVTWTKTISPGTHFIRSTLTPVQALQFPDISRPNRGMIALLSAAAIVYG